MKPSIERVRTTDVSGRVTDIRLWPRVDLLVRRLDQRGARRCGIACTSAGAFVVALMAVITSGRTAVLLAPSRSGSPAGDASVDVVLTDQSGGNEAQWLAVPGLEARGDGAQRSFDAHSEIWFHTSGSSGQPGIVHKRFELLFAEIMAIVATFEGRLSPATVVASVPLYHRFGFLFGCMLPVLNDWPLHVRQCMTPGALRAVLNSQRAIIVSSPAILDSLRELELALPAAQVEAIFSAGAPAAAGLARWVHEHCGRAPIDIYGSTEMGTVAWRQWLPDEPVMVWRALEQVEMRIRADARGGRLHVRAGFTEGWVVGDDYVRAQADGFELLGRVDSVVKVADKRVSLSDMRTVLQRHAWVTDARIVKIPGAHARLGAVVILNAAGRGELSARGRSEVVSSLRAALAAAYEPVLVPRKWRFIARWPDDALGKVKHEFLLRVLEQPA